MAPVITLSVSAFSTYLSVIRLTTVVEDAEVRIGVLAGGDLADESADNREGDDRSGNPEHDAADV
jgi:hypothetical protein